MGTGIHNKICNWMSVLAIQEETKPQRECTHSKECECTHQPNTEKHHYNTPLIAVPAQMYAHKLKLNTHNKLGDCH